MKQKLTKLQREVVKRINRLFKSNAPLNICAVKRNHPELMKTVYDIKPFWGWKRALEAAGIDYSKIRVELKPYVTCQICGKELISLGSHINKIHGADKDDYHIDYPDMPLASEELRANITRMKSRFVEHWERLWTPEYVMDRVAEFCSRNLPVNMKWIANNEKAFFHHATLYFGGWANVLTAAGLDPRAIYRKFEWRYPAKDKIVAAIKQRYRKSLPLGVVALCKGNRKSRDCALWFSGKKLFGSWHAAIVAAGIDPIRLQKKIFRDLRRYPDSRSVIREIRRRRESGLDIHRAGVCRGQHVDQALERSGIEYFGSWNAALKAAGFEPKVIAVELLRRLSRYPDREAVVGAIKSRARAGLPVNTAALVSGERSGQTLWRAAKRFFGSWNVAFVASGLDPIQTHRDLWARHSRYPDAKAIMREIRRRLRAGVGFWKGGHRDQALTKRARVLFSSWANALKAAGIEPETARKKERGKERKERGQSAHTRRKAFNRKTGNSETGILRSGI